MKPRIEDFQKQLDFVTHQTTTLFSQDKEDKLEDAFSTFAKGKVSLSLDNRIYQEPSVPAGQPLVYLTSYSSITSNHDMSDIHRFFAGITDLSFRSVYGTFALHNGPNSALGTIVPNSYCSQVIYYDPAFQAAAIKVSLLVAESFHIATPVVKLIPVTSSQIDLTSKTVIQEAGINVAAAVAIPSPSVCSAILSQY